MKWTTRCLFLTALFCWAAPVLVSQTAHAQDGSGEKSKTKEKKAKKKPKHGGFAVGPTSMTRYAVEDETVKNEVTFTSKAPKETIVGKTGTILGHLDLNPRKLAKAKGEFRVSWESIDTGNPMRNEHLRSAPWVDAASHPEIVFTLKDVENIKRNKSGKSVKAKLVGTMAMNGEEKDLKVPATLVYLEPKTDGEKEVKEGIGIRAQFTVALADFNIQGRGVGNAVAAKQKIKVNLFLARAEDEKKDKEEPTTPQPKPLGRSPRQG